MHTYTNLHYEIVRFDILFCSEVYSHIQGGSVGTNIRNNSLVISFIEKGALIERMRFCSPIFYTLRDTKLKLELFSTTPYILYNVSRVSWTFFTVLDKYSNSVFSKTKSNKSHCSGTTGWGWGTTQILLSKSDSRYVPSTLLVGSNGEFWRTTRQASLPRLVPDSSKLTARLHVAIIAKQRAPVRETATAERFRHDGWRRSWPKNLDVCQRWEKIGRRVARRQRLPVCLAIQDDVTRESAEEGWR